MPKLEQQKNAKIFSVTELVLETFCDDISSMFGMSLNCEAVQQAEQANIEDLRKGFRKISAAFKVSSKGALNGDFWVVLDTVGIFVLSGVFVMLPEKIITQRSKSGTLEEANNIEDAIGEVGNLLVGSWDRVYREELEGHEHLLQTQTTVNKDWASLLETLNISEDAVGYQTFKIEVESYDPVNMAVIYPQELFDDSVTVEDSNSVDDVAQDSDADSANEATDESSGGASQESAQATETLEPSSEPEVTAKEEISKEDAPQQEETQKVEEPTQDVATSDTETKPQESSGQSQEQEIADESAQTEESVEATDSKATQDTQEESQAQADIEAKDDSDKADEVVAAEQQSQAQGPVSQAIKEMVSNGNADSSSLNLSISDIMDKDVVWASKDDSVEKLISLMQSQDIGYVLIGSDKTVEGVVSGSDIKGAISPYLQSMFANWRRPQDIATLQIKAKWIMSCAVTTVPSDARFSVAARLLYEKDLNVLPVTDKSGKVCGVITSDEVMRIFMLNIGIDADKPMRRAPIL